MAHRTNCFVLNTLLTCIFITNPLTGEEITELLVFGPSSADAGNVFAISILPPPVGVGARIPAPSVYHEGRFSNGPIWIDILADRMGLARPAASETGGTNYAWGAATTGSVRGDTRVLTTQLQVEEYLAEKTPSAGQLFIVSGMTAINDFGNGQTDPAKPVEFLSNQITALANAGARNFLVPNGARTNRLPVGLVDEYNVLLDAEIEKLRSALPISVIEVNSAAILDGILAHPQLHGITETVLAACRDCDIGTNPFPMNVADNPDEFFFIDAGPRGGGHYTATVNRVWGEAAFEATQRLIDEDFNQIAFGERPDRTSLFDSSSDQAETRPWGPGIVEVVDGKIHFETTGLVPPRTPEEPLETGVMVLTWDESETNEAFANGFLRATVQSSTASDANLLLRGDVESLSGYLFTGVGPSGQFEIHRFDEAGSTFLGKINQPAFTVGEDWIMEAGAVDDVISLKVWPADGPEPELPQLVLTDDGLSSGAAGLAPAISTARIQSLTQLDVTYDDVTFLPSVLGDLNVNSILDAGDIDLLSAAIASDKNHPFLDLNNDESVNEEDRRIWVEGLSNTFFGDADLNGSVEFADFVALSENFGMDGGWSKGNFDGQDGVDFSDFVLLSANFGNVRAASVASVPEPSGRMHLPLVFAAIAAIRSGRGICRRRRLTAEL